MLIQVILTQCKFYQVGIVREVNTHFLKLFKKIDKSFPLNIKTKFASKFLIECNFRTIEMGADRIGHGVQAVLDEPTMQMMKDAGVTVEICGVCNIQSIPINTQGLAIHPIQQFIDRGIKVSLSTDNDALCGSNITKEYNQFLLTGHSNFLNWNTVKQSARDGIDAAFISDADKVSAKNILESRINQIQRMVEDVANEYEQKANRPVRVGVLDVFGAKHKGIASKTN